MDSSLIMDDGKSPRLLDFLRQYNGHDGNAGFAFLSACETAMGEHNARDEAIHLAAGMLLVGYESVVGSMWKVNAKDSEYIVTPFYEQMLGVGKGDCLYGAKALHDALMLLRKEQAESVNGWVNIVHWGI
jgi:CHAT domain-containing protein